MLLLAAVVGLQACASAAASLPAGAAASVLYVRSPEALTRMALSYDALLADVYWIRAVQHYGGTKLATDAEQAATTCSIRCSI